MEQLVYSKTYLQKAGTEGFRHITEDTYNKIIEYCLARGGKMVEYAKLFKLLWLFGLRISEALQIKTGDFYRRDDGYVLLINREKKRKPYQDEIEVPNDVALEYISWFQVCGFKPNEKVFSMTRQAVNSMLKKIGKHIGMKISPHMFRHGRVYQLISKGVHPLLITKMMGWSNLNMIMQYYHPKKGDMRNAW